MPLASAVPSAISARSCTCTRPSRKASVSACDSRTVMRWGSTATPSSPLRFVSTAAPCRKVT